MSGLQSVKVLIVDPAGYSRRLLYGIFPLLEIRDIRSADRADLAMAELQSHHRDVVFCDEETRDMPVFMKSLRGGRYGATPVFLVAAAITQDQILAARDCGVTGVILKPVSAETLERKLRAALAISREGEERRVEERRRETIAIDFPDRRSRPDRRVEFFPPAGGTRAD